MCKAIGRSMLRFLRVRAVLQLLSASSLPPSRVMSASPANLMWGLRFCTRPGLERSPPSRVEMLWAWDERQDLTPRTVVCCPSTPAFPLSGELSQGMAGMAWLTERRGGLTTEIGKPITPQSRGYCTVCVCCHICAVREECVNAASI